MTYSVRRGKLTSKRKLRDFKTAFKLVNDMPPEAYERFSKMCHDIGPKETAKTIWRMMLAAEVGEKVCKDLPDGPLPPDFIAEVLAEHPDIDRKFFKDKTLHDAFAHIPEDHIIEVLEQMVEGDLVIDDAATHQWFRKKLDDYRDACTAIDADDVTEPLMRSSFLLASFDRYDCLIECEAGSILAGVLIGNAKAREALKGFEALEWKAIAIPEDMSKGFQTAGFSLTLGAKADKSVEPVTKFAQMLVTAAGLRVATIDQWGDIRPVEAGPAMVA